MDTNILIRILDKNEFDKYIRNKNSIIIQSSWNEPTNTSDGFNTWWGQNGTARITNIYADLMQDNKQNNNAVKAFSDNDYSSDTLASFYMCGYGNDYRQNIPFYCSKDTVSSNYTFSVGTEHGWSPRCYWEIYLYTSFRPVFEFVDNQNSTNIFI